MSVSPAQTRMIYAHQTRFGQSLLNLASNANKFTGPPWAANVTCRQLAVLEFRNAAGALREGEPASAVLRPVVRDRRLVAPFEKPWHGAPVRPRLHERAHRRLVGPYSTCPEGEVGIVENRHREVPKGAPRLMRRGQHMKKKGR